MNSILHFGGVSWKHRCENLGFDLGGAVQPFRFFFFFFSRGLRLLPPHCWTPGAENRARKTNIFAVGWGGAGLVITAVGPSMPPPFPATSMG